MFKKGNKRSRKQYTIYCNYFKVEKSLVVVPYSGFYLWGSNLWELREIRITSSQILILQVLATRQLFYMCHSPTAVSYGLFNLYLKVQIFSQAHVPLYEWVISNNYKSPQQKWLWFLCTSCWQYSTSAVKLKQISL